MNDPTRDRPEEAPLNPALKSTTETVYDTSNPSPPPIDTTSAQEGEGEGEGAPGQQIGQIDRTELEPEGGEHQDIGRGDNHDHSGDGRQEARQHLTVPSCVSADRQ